MSAVRLDLVLREARRTDAEGLGRAGGAFGLDLVSGGGGGTASGGGGGGGGAKFGACWLED